MKLQLPEDVSSSQDVRSIIMELRQCAQWLSQSAVKTQVTKKPADAAPVMTPATNTLVLEWADGKSLDQKALSELITTLESFEAKSQRITVTLAGPVTRDLKKTLVSWFRQHIDPNVLVDIRFNSTILGGMVIQYGSHIYDWSFRRQILAARSKFPEVLRGV